MSAIEGPIEDAIEDQAWPAEGMLGRLRWRSADPADQAQLLAMMQAFYMEDRIAYDETRILSALAALRLDPALGTVLLLSAEDGEVAGYLVLGVCFSLEQGGRHALLDELYLGSSMRGRGLGGQALALARQWAVQAGLPALRLEVHRHNPRAKSLYERAGFVDDHRDMLTLRLDVPA